MIRRLIVAAAGLSLAVGLASAERIARVVDGDTVVTASGERMPLMHFDEPETHGECPRERDLARVATPLAAPTSGQQCGYGGRSGSANSPSSVSAP